jgi:hypothetical protein
VRDENKSSIGLRRFRDASLVVVMFTGLSLVVSVGTIYGRIASRLESVEQRLDHSIAIREELTRNFVAHASIPIDQTALERIVRLDQRLQDMERRLARIER